MPWTVSTNGSKIPGTAVPHITELKVILIVCGTTALPMKFPKIYYKYREEISKYREDISLGNVKIFTVGMVTMLSSKTIMNVGQKVKGTHPFGAFVNNCVFRFEDHADREVMSHSFHNMGSE